MNFASEGIAIPVGKSGEYKTTCPKCSKSRRKHGETCLSVNIDEKIWNCHHCGWSGGLKQKAQSMYARPDFTPRPVKAKPLQFFLDRGISQEVLAKFQISAGERYFPQTDKVMEALEFPYFENGEIVNVKYRGRGKVFTQVAKAKKTLYNIDAAGSEIVICEGEMDVLSLATAGIDAVSVPNGAPSPKTKNYARSLDYLDNDFVQEKLAAAERIVLATDSDVPGKTLQDELARRLGRERCYRVIWPEGCKDANEVLMQAGAEALQNLIDGAEPYPIVGLFSTMDFRQEVLDLYDHGYRKGLSTGFSNLDEYYTIRTQEYTTVTGIPSHGKTEVMECIEEAMARLHGWRIAKFSPESMPVQRMIARIIEKHTRLPFGRGPNERITPQQLADAMDWVHNHFYFMEPKEDFTLKNILNLAEKAVSRYGVKGIVIDPWNHIEHQIPSGMTETLYVSHALQKFIRFCQRMDVHLWLIAHPVKMRKNEDGTQPVPTPYDISGSANFYNKGYNCLSVWRDISDDGAPVKVYVQKIKFKEVGKLGSIELRYDRITGTYTPLESNNSVLRKFEGVTNGIF